MSAQDLLRVIRESEIQMEVRGGRVYLSPGERVTEEIREWGAKHRDVILWALYRRRGGYPRNELWLRPDDWQRWMEVCGISEAQQAA